MTRYDPVSLTTGARSDAADQVLVVCCPMGVRRRLKRNEDARWGHAAPFAVRKMDRKVRNARIEQSAAPNVVLVHIGILCTTMSGY